MRQAFGALALDHFKKKPSVQHAFQQSSGLVQALGRVGASLKPSIRCATAGRAKAALTGHTANRSVALVLLLVEVAGL